MAELEKPNVQTLGTTSLVNFKFYNDKTGFVCLSV